ncbi:uncharacterized protein ACA1_234300 [Acanthamoeba castellanii str. Neff]|uniref:DUF4209 domain-containing protein n=1 Tax=Acanthamoeba castellanii (strain ATCC 30010 / Neff) TaxID=1257118 RepID=L8H195_ACACF|nr:uncharacterized protein ACA1_234300 [Acanthamoeba castellanii str. Neff]ELR18992.1 hypothetical protein ACA1_234300 [Acanthamoeba castellanii str. Neff]
MHGGQQHRPHGRVGEGVAALERLGRLGVHQSSLSPRIAALLRVDEEDRGQVGQQQQQPPQQMEDPGGDEERLYDTYFQVVEEGKQDEDGGGGSSSSSMMRGLQGVPLLNWGWWRKRRFLSVEDEERVARCAAQRERKSVTWVETYFHEFALAAHHVKRAALVLHRRLGCATTLQQQPQPPSTSNQGHQPPPPPLRQEGCSRALLLPHLRWLRPCDPEWVDQLWIEVRRSPLVGSSMLVTYLEKALGDLLCWKTEGRQRVPCRINDLLGEPALQDLLGPDAVFVVRCLVGPPNGLNIRNLLWHGFLDNEQLHPALLAQLMAFSAWGEALDGGQEPLEAVAPADTMAAPSSSESTRRARHVKSRGGKGGTGSHLRRLEAMDRRFASDFGGSHFVLPQRVAPWVEALQVWMGIELAAAAAAAARDEPVGLTRERDREEYRCLLVMLPQLEHSLRRVFVAVNEFAEERLLTAEAAVYYTTLDIMTAQRHDPEAYAEGENYVTGDAHGPLNRLPLELGQPMMHLLRDLNDWFAGPRLRIKDLIMVAAIALCARYDPCPAMQGTSALLERRWLAGGVGCGPFVSRCVEYVEAYRPYYHPVSILQRRISGCLEAWGRHHRLSIADSGELGGPASPDAPCDVEADESALRSLISAVSTHLETLYGHPPLFISPDADQAPRQLLPDDPHFGAFGLTKRVFCSRHEESVTALLTDVVGLVREILAEVSVRYEALGKLVAERRAYHHQRRIFTKLRASLPYFGLLAQLVMLLVEETARRQDRLEQAAAAATHDCPAAAAAAADAAATPRLERGPPLPDQSEDQTTQEDDAFRLQAQRKERARREKEATEHSPTFTLARAVQDLLGRQLGCVRENEWDKAREILGCWLGEEERTYRLLSKRERFKFWAALPAHLPFPVPACGATAAPTADAPTPRREEPQN